MPCSETKISTTTTTKREKKSKQKLTRPSAIEVGRKKESEWMETAHLEDGDLLEDGEIDVEGELSLELVRQQSEGSVDVATTLDATTRPAVVVPA